MQIEDSQGSGHGVGVTSENRLKANSVVEVEQLHVNQKHADSYSVVVSKTPAGANDCFCYIKNTDEKKLIISALKLRCDADESVQVKLGTLGTPVSGSALTPKNRNAGSGHEADCTCEEGEVITGLTSGETVDDLWVDGNTNMQTFRWLSGLIIPKNNTISFHTTVGGSPLKMTVSTYFHDSA